MKDGMTVIQTHWNALIRQKDDGCILAAVSFLRVLLKE